MSQTIRNYLVEIIRDILSISTFATESRTRSEKIRNKTNTSQSTWSQNWAMNKSEFCKVVINLKRKTNLFSIFFSRHSRQSSFAKTSAESTFFSLILRLSEILSSLNLADQLILIDRILTEKQFRSFFSSFLTIVFSSFNFTSYQHAVVRVFDESRSNIQSSISKSILDFIEYSKSVQTVVSKFLSFRNSDEQVAQFVIEQMISRNITRLEKLTITSIRNISLIFQNVFFQSIANESSSTFTKQSFFDMTNNARNAEFETINIDESREENSNQGNTIVDQITNQFARSVETTSDVMFSHAQRMKIADIVIAALRMNRQNNSFSDISSVSSSMTSIFETRFDRWNATDLEFFDSAYEEKIISSAKSIQHANKNTYFRDVHFFVDRAKDIALFKD